MTKKLLTTVLVLGLLVSAGYFGTKSVLAWDQPQFATLTTRIAQKFNLKEDDVEAVFEAVRDERLAEIKISREEKLAQAVADGVITQSQKEVLLVKMNEHMTKKQSERDEMQKWFADQGIDASKLKTYLGFGHGKGFGPPRGF